MSISIGDAILKIGVDKSDFDTAMGQMSANIQSSMQKLQAGFKVGGAALTAFGAAGLKVSDTARELNAQLGQTAITLGVSTGQMRELALSLTNVTFPLKEVTATMDLLARAGIRDAETLKTTAAAFDTLGDAVGSTASVVTDQMVMAMKTYQLSAQQIAAETDNITYLVRNTALSMDNFASVVGYITPELVEMGLTMGDTIALLGIMESKGVSGSVATRAFRTAITEATNTQIPLNEALGVTQEEMESYRAKLEASTGLTQKFADENNKQYGILDKVKQKFDEITLAAGSFLTPLEPVLGAMTALGPAMLFFSNKTGIATAKVVAQTLAQAAHTAITKPAIIAAKAAAAAQWLWNAAMAANPIGLIILGIAALIAAIILLWKNWDKVTKFFKEAWHNIKMFFLQGVASILESLSKFTAFIPGLNKLVESAREKIAGMMDAESAKDNAAEMIRTTEAWAEEERRIIEEQTQAKREELEKQRGNAKSAYENEIDDLRKTYGILEGCDDDYTETKMDAARRLSDERGKALDRQMSDERRAYDERIAMIDSEYAARLKLVDEEAAAAIAMLNNQIDAIRAQQDAEEKARRDQENAERQAELEEKVAGAKTEKERIAAQKELDDFLTQLAIEAAREQRDAQINSLRDQIEAVRESAAHQKDRLQEEQDAKIAAEKAKLDATLTALQAEKDGLDTALQAELERLETERQAAEDAAQARLDATLQRIDDETEAMEKHLADELLAIQQHVADVNEATAKLLDRTITITTVHRDVRSSGSGSSATSSFAGLPQGIIAEPVLSKMPFAVAGSGPKPASVGITISGNFYIREEADIEKVASAMVTKIRLKTGLKL